MFKKISRIVLLIALSCLLFACNISNKGFEGKKESDENHFILTYEILNKSLTHDFDLKQGETIVIHIDNESGDLKIDIKKDDGEPIYEGNGKVTSDFAINIETDGIYTVCIAGKNAKGEISFIRQQ